MARIDLTNKDYGRWRVLRFSHSIYKGLTKVAYWHCRCACGTEKPVSAGTLRNGTSVSCGKCGTKSLNRKGHGMSYTPEYSAWAHMVQRCRNPNNDEFKNYGARGISVCERWLTFDNFRADMGARPSARHTLERRDNNKGYSPDNCCWATHAVQNRNHRRNRWIEWNGQSKLITEWSTELGGKRHSLTTRLSRGWTLERAMSTRF